MFEKLKREVKIVQLILEFLASFSLLLVANLMAHTMRDLSYCLNVAICTGVIMIICNSLQGDICVNPAFALSNLLHQREKSVIHTFAVIFVEIFGAFLGTLAGYFVTKEIHSFSQLTYSLPIGKSVSSLNIFLAEMLFSSLLALVYVEGRATRPSEIRNIFLVLTYVISYGAIGAISGASLNAIVSLGNDLTYLAIHHKLDDQNVVVYFVGPFLGAFIAWFTIQLVAHFLWSELIGSFYITLTNLCIVGTSQSTKLKILKQGNLPFGGKSEVAACIGLIYMCISYCFGRNSGAHYNPAISVGTLYTNKNRLTDVIVYCFMHLAGATIGAFFARLVCGVLPEIHNILDEHDKNGQILLLTIIFSMMLMCVYTIQLAKSFGDPPGFLIGTVYLCNFLSSSGKSEINPAISVSIYIIEFIYGARHDFTNVIAKVIVPMGATLFSMSLLKNIPEGRRVDSF